MISTCVRRRCSSLCAFAWNCALFVDAIIPEPIIMEKARQLLLYEMVVCGSKCNERMISRPVFARLCRSGERRIEDESRPCFLRKPAACHSSASPSATSLYSTAAGCSSCGARAAAIVVADEAEDEASVTLQSTTSGCSPSAEALV